MQNIYDNKKFFDEYISMRDKGINANNLIEKPIFRALLPSFKDKKVLDLGCGYGDLCKLAEEDGARKIVGVDISKKMLEMAKNISSSDKITYLNLPMEKLNEINEKFDFVISSLAFHYVENFESRLITKYTVITWSSLGTDPFIFKTSEWVSSSLHFPGLL